MKVLIMLLHKELFDHLREVGHDLESRKELANLQFNMIAHFGYEKLYPWKVPLSDDDVELLKKWLVHKIKI